MKSSLTIIKIVLTVASIVSIGTALGATIYFGVLKSNPPVAVQPTPTITQILTPTVTPTLTPTITPNIDTSDWKTYRNEMYSFEFKYPQNWWIGEEKPNWQGNVNESYDPYLIVMLNASGIPNDFMVPILCKENITYENFLKFYENSNHKISTIKDIVFKGMEGKLVSNYNVSVKKESRFVVLQFKDKMKCSLFQPTVEDSDYPFDHKYNSTINQILSTFKFTEK